MPSPDEPDEFALIARHFAPLATGKAARGLLDDAALLDASGPLVITADAIVEGVHFLPDDPLDTVAQKALRVNLSDLAAKGARPLGYTLSLIWPRGRANAGMGEIARGLALDQARFGFELLGGDTTSTPGPLCLAITMLGQPLGPVTPDRRGGKPGDRLFVSGPIGEAYLGLRALQEGAAAIPEAPRLIARYRLPEPRLDLASMLGANVTAAMDVSDGLYADAAKLAAASGCAAVLRPHLAPLSDAAKAWAGEDQGRLHALLSGGDDYEILAAAHGAGAQALLDAGFREVGFLRAGPGLFREDEAGAQSLLTGRLGFVHALD